MPVTPGPKLRKVTLNLFESDVAFLQEHFGEGYSVEIRACIEDWTNRLRGTKETFKRGSGNTLGDLLKEEMVGDDDE